VAVGGVVAALARVPTVPVLNDGDVVGDVVDLAAQVAAVRAPGETAEAIHHSQLSTRPRDMYFYYPVSQSPRDGRRLRLPRRGPARPAGRRRRPRPIRDDDGDPRELRTDGAYLDALTDAITTESARFNADSVAEVLCKSLGSSVHVWKRPSRRSPEDRRRKPTAPTTHLFAPDVV